MSFARYAAAQLGNPSGIAGNLAAFVWNRRNAVLNDVVFDALNPGPTDRVLEVGFGGGYLLGRMSAIVTDGLLTGVDISPAMVRLCEKRHRSLVKSGRLELKVAQAESLPFPSGHFNKACSVNSIFYWHDAQRALSELARVLSEDGHLVLCFTHKESLERRGFAKHVALYDPEDIERMAMLCGLWVTTKRASDMHREFLCMTARKKP